MIHFNFNFYGWVMLITSIIMVFVSPFYIGQSRGVTEPIDIMFNIIEVVIILLALQGRKKGSL